MISRRTALIFLLPSLLLVFVFLILPAVWTLYFSLTDYSLLGASTNFVGPKNFITLFTSSRFWHSTIISFEFVILSAIFGQAVLGLIIAIVFHRRSGLIKQIVTNLAIASWLIPAVVVAYAWAAFLDKEYGFLNQMIATFGFSPIDWLNSFPMGSIIVFNIWRGTAFSMLLFTSALKTIPPSHFETADVMGASLWNKIKDVILPQLKTFIGSDLALITLWTFNLFTPFLLTGGGPGYKTEILPIYTYHKAFKYMEFGFGSAIAAFILFVNLCFTLIYLRYLKEER